MELDPEHSDTSKKEKSKSYKDVEAIHKLLTCQLAESLDLDFQLLEIKDKISKRNRDAIQYVAQDLRNKGEVDGDALIHSTRNRRLTKSELAEILIDWVTFHHTSKS